MLNLHTRHASNLFPLDLHLILFMSYVVTVLYFFYESSSTTYRRPHKRTSPHAYWVGSSLLLSTIITLLQNRSHATGQDVSTRQENWPLWTFYLTNLNNQSMSSHPRTKVLLKDESRRLFHRVNFAAFSLPRCMAVLASNITNLHAVETQSNNISRRKQRVDRCICTRILHFVPRSPN